MHNEEEMRHSQPQQRSLERIDAGHKMKVRHGFQKNSPFVYASRVLSVSINEAFTSTFLFQVLKVRRLKWASTERLKNKKKNETHYAEKV